MTLDGKKLKDDAKAFKLAIGVVPQEIALYNELSAYNNLLFWGGMYNIPDAELKSRIDETLTLFGLYDRRLDKVKTYSGGMKRRINIAAALLHKPGILFMDEPTVGIDPQSRNLIFEVIDKLHKEGMTILYTTHYMEEAERLCDRIGIIDNGNIIAQGTLDELKSQSKIKESVLITFNNLTEELSSKITQNRKDMKTTENGIHFYSSEIKKELSKIIVNCTDIGLDINHIDIMKVNLETIFLELTGKKLRD